MTADPLDMPPMRRTMRSVELLLSPEQILEILRDFTLYTSLAVGSQTIPIKVIPRYPQVEGVHAIVARAMDPAKRQVTNRAVASARSGIQCGSFRR